MYQAFLYLLGAITADVISNLLLKFSDRFHRKKYGFSAILLALLAFSCLIQAIKTIDLSKAYAIWGGLGLIATTLLDYFLFEQTIDAKGWLGLSLITCGVAILTFS